MRNKKSNVPVTILVLGIVLVSALAIASFLLAKNSISDFFSSVYLIEKMNSQMEKYSFGKSLVGMDTRYDGDNKLVFYQERKDSSGVLFWKRERVVFSVEYPVP